MDTCALLAVAPRMLRPASYRGVGPVKRVVWVVSLLLCGCASTQLTYNVLDVASSTSKLAREQILHNLAEFIDSRAATPAQVVFGQGSVSTENSLSTTFTDPISKTIQTTATVAKAATSTITNSAVGTTTDKTLGLTGGNTANQSWGIDTIGDPDVLRRVYDLYRFAVDGNDCPHTQIALLRDYPLAYQLTNGGANSTAPTLAIDPNSMLGANCVLCGVNSASSSPNAIQVCDGSDGTEAVSAVEPAPGVCQQGGLAPRQKWHRLELKGISSSFAAKNTSTASQLLNQNGKVCLTINRRLLPKPHHGRWLLWEALPGASRPTSIPAPNPAKDIYLGTYGGYALYADGEQQDRFAEFVIFITAASASVPNPSSQGSATGQGQSKAPSATVLATGSGR